MADCAGLIVAREGRLGRITLDRPRVLNALTLEMIEGLHEALDRFAEAEDVVAVVLDAAGDRAFCAGGDIKSLYLADHSAGHPLARQFWRREYALDHKIAIYGKPLIALVGGMVMGGGAGLAIHARFRIIDASTQFAMPETGIGLIPDVGASRFLARMPGETGTYLALTGESINAADMLATGLADAFISHVRHAEFLDLLNGINQGQQGFDDVAALVRRLETPRGPSHLMARDTLQRLFDADRVETILQRLDADGSAWAIRTAQTIRSKSPTATKLALRALRRGRSLPDLAAALTLEYRIVCRLAEAADFHEGIRAAIIDKDHAPHWRPERLEAVTAADLDRFFAPLGADELIL